MGRGGDDEEPRSVDADDDLMAACRAMRAQRVRRTPVVCEGRLVGA